MESKLGLNMELVEQARASAAKVADDTQQFIDQHTTVTVERAVCRLLGIDGVNDMDVPLPNVVVDHLMANSLLPVGAAWAIGNAMVETGKDPQGVADAVNSGELDLSKVPAHSDAEIRGAITPVVNATMEETSVEDIASNVTTQLLRGAKTKNETLSMEAKPTHEDSDPVEIIVVVDDSVAKPAAQAQVKSLLQKQEKAAATMSRAIGETVEPQRQ